MVSNLSQDSLQLYPYGALIHEIDTTIAHEEAKFIPVKVVCVQHIEHVYECKQCRAKFIYCTWTYNHCHTTHNRDKNALKIS